MLCHEWRWCDSFDPWQDRKQEYLKQSIEKLAKAISLNDDYRTHEGELAHFALGNAL